MAHRSSTDQYEALRALLATSREDIQHKLRKLIEAGDTVGEHQFPELYRSITRTLGGYVKTTLEPFANPGDPVWFLWPGYRWLTNRTPQRVDVLEFAKLSVESSQALKSLETMQIGEGRQGGLGRGSQELNTVLPLSVWMAALYGREMEGVSLLGFTEWWHASRNQLSTYTGRCPVAIEVSCDASESRCDDVISLTWQANEKPEIALRQIKADLEHYWSTRNWNRYGQAPAFPFPVAEGGSNVELPPLAEELWGRLIGSMFETSNSSVQTDVDRLKQILHGGKEEVDGGSRETVKWLTATLEAMTGFRKNKSTYRGGFKYFYAIPMPPCFPMNRHEGLDDDLGTLNLYSSFRIPANILEVLGLAGRTFYEPLRILEVVADKERRDWHVFFGHVRHNLDGGVRVMKHEIETLKAQALDSSELDRDSLLASLDVISGSLNLQKSLYNSLEDYASLVTTYSSGTVEPSETVLQDRATTGSLAELISDCAAGATQRLRLKHRGEVGQFGTKPTFSLPDPADIDQPIAISSTSALTHVLLELMVNATKYTPEGEPILVSARLVGSDCVITITNRASQVKKMLVGVSESDWPLCEHLGITPNPGCALMDYSVAGACEGCRTCTERWWTRSLNKDIQRLSLGEGTGIGLGQLRTIVLRALAGRLDVTASFDGTATYPCLVTATLRIPYTCPE